MDNQVTIAGIQMSMSGCPADNVRKAQKLVRAAVRRGAQIICLPELYRTLYFPQQKSASKESLAETIPGESTDVFGALAKELGVTIIVPIYECAIGKKPSGKRGRVSPRYFNS